jgi:hypothetical protein
MSFCRLTFACAACPPQHTAGLVRMVVLVAVVFLDGRTSADMMCSLPEGPGLLAPKVDLLPLCVSSRCSEKQRWSSSSSKGSRVKLSEGKENLRPPALGMGSGPRDVILPDMYRTVPEALEAANAGDRIFFREGRFVWDNLAVVREHMRITGDDKSCLLGAWLFNADTAGLFQGVCCAVKHEQKAALPDAAITSFSADWILEDCELRALHSPVIRLLDSANMTLLYCNIGGLGAGEAAADDDSLRATDAVVAMFDANVVLYRCCIEDTGDADTRPPRDLRGNIIQLSHTGAAAAGLRATNARGKAGALIQVAGSKPTAPQPLFTLCGGVRLFHSAKARLEQCTACNNDVTLTVSASASAVVRKCRLTCGNEGFALLRGGTHFTCFTRTQVQILPPEVRRAQCYVSLEAAFSSFYLLC